MSQTSRGMSELHHNVEEKHEEEHRHEKIKPFAKLLIGIESPIYAFHYNFRYTLGPKGSFLVEMEPGQWTFYTNISIFVCCVLAVVLGVLSDSYISKYYTLLIGLAACLISSGIVFVAAVVDLGPLRKTANAVGLFWMCLYLVIEPLRFGLFCDQLPAKMVPHQAGHVFLLYQEMKTMGSILYLGLNRFVASMVNYGETPLSLAILYMLIPLVYTLVIAGLYKFVNRGQFTYAIGIDCISCFVRALHHKFFKGEKIDGHWIETARDAFDSKTIRSTKIMSSLIFIYMTLFSYGMTSSLMRHAWNDQVKNLIENMDMKKIYGDVNIIYFSMTVLFLPMIEYFLLPFWSKYRKPLTELQRIGITVFLTGISFISTTVVQLEIEKHTSLLPSSHYAQVRIFNVHNVDVTISADWNFPPTTILGHGHIGAWNVESQATSLYTMRVEAKNGVLNYTGILATELGESLSYLIGRKELLRVEENDPIHFGPPGTNKDDYVRVYMINYTNGTGDEIMPEGKDIIFSNSKHSYTEKAPRVGSRKTFQVRPGTYNITCSKFDKIFKCDPSVVTLKTGALYAILPLIKENVTLTFKPFTILNPAVYSAAVVLPQIAMLSFADAMGKIPINMFIFKESPLELRSSSIAMYVFFRDSSAIVFAIFHEVFRYQVDSFQLVLVTGVHMVFCFLYVYAALRHQKYPEEDMMKRRRAIMKSA